MAEDTESQNQGKDASPPADDGEVISLEDLDQIIAEEDPEFSQQMKQISEDDDLKKADLEVMNLDENVEGEVAEEEKSTFIDKYPRLKKLINPLFKIKAFATSGILSLVDRFTDGIMNSFYWLKKDSPAKLKELLGQSKKWLKIIVDKVKLRIDLWKKVPKRQKLGYFASVVAILAVGVLVKSTLHEGWLPEITHPLLKSLEKPAEYVRAYDVKKDVVRLYDAFPQPEDFFQLPKIVVNLRRVRPYENPMAAAEVYLEVDSNETAVELKDRVKQVLDVLERTVEGFSYGEIRSISGKAKLKANIRYNINEILNQGRVTKVYVRNLILKP